MDEDEIGWDSGQPLDYEQMVQVMTLMGFLPKRMQKGRTGFMELQEFWLLVQGEKRGGIMADHLFQLLEIIKGIRYADREVFYEYDR